MFKYQNSEAAADFLIGPAVSFREQIDKLRSLLAGAAGAFKRII